jgi:hypothetical protein
VYGGRTVSQWLEDLDDRAPDVRLEALYALAYFPDDPRANAALVALMHDPYAPVRLTAAGACWSFNLDRDGAVGVLGAAAKSDARAARIAQQIAASLGASLIDAMLARLNEPVAQYGPRQDEAQVVLELLGDRACLPFEQFEPAHEYAKLRVSLLRAPCVLADIERD